MRRAAVRRPRPHPVRDAESQRRADSDPNQGPEHRSSVGGGDPAMSAEGSRATIRVGRRTGRVVPRRMVTTASVLDQAGLDSQCRSRRGARARAGRWLDLVDQPVSSLTRGAAGLRDRFERHARWPMRRRAAPSSSVAADPAFAIAHATLARAYDELDYTERPRTRCSRRRCGAGIAADARGGTKAPRDAVHGLAGLSARGPTGAADRGGVGRSRSTRCCPGVGLALPS